MIRELFSCIYLHRTFCAITCKNAQSRPMVKQSGGGCRYPRNNAKTTNHDNATYPFQGSPMKSRPSSISCLPSPGWTTACPDQFGPEPARTPSLPRHEPPAVCWYGSASTLKPLRSRDSAPFDFRRRTCCRLPGPKTERSEVVFSWHKNPASVFWLPHRTTSPCGAAPPSLLPRVAYRTIRRSPGSPRIRGTGRRSSPTPHAA